MTDAPIPLVDLQVQHRVIADEVRAGHDRVMAEGCFTDGPDVAAFEAEFAEFSGAAHVIGCASGTDALEIALRAVDVGPGHEVLVPANTFAATAEAVVRVGARPVFVDVEPETLTIDVVSAAAAVTDATKAVIPVHLYGRLADMDAVDELAHMRGLTVIADAAQSQGAERDGRGIAAGVSAAATSFYPGKNLGAYGDGGAVVTDDDRIAALARSISHHGVDGDRYRHERFGFTSRLDTMQAVVLRAKLAHLATWNEERRAAAARYDRLLGEVLGDLPDDLLGVVEGVHRPPLGTLSDHVWHLYAVQVTERDAVLEALRARGIGAGIHYPVPLHLQPAFREGAPARGELLIAERAAECVLSLPLYPGITAEQQERVVEALAQSVRTPQLI
jgi:dTDP-4-amino-4,6-dideoxygalactose transaminase